MESLRRKVAAPKAPEQKPQTMNYEDYLLAELRCASLRARIIQADIDAVGLAFKHHLISADQAIALLHDVDVLRLVGPAPAEVS
jgi:hypothetical protein